MIFEAVSTISSRSVKSGLSNIQLIFLELNDNKKCLDNRDKLSRHFVFFVLISMLVCY